MTLATHMTTDSATFFSTDDFAVSATFKAATISVIFSEPYQNDMGYENSAPSALAKTSDVSAAVRKDTIVIGGTTYYITGMQPSEDGLLTLLTLSTVSP